MAFFGLTSLGPQSPFDAAKETPLHVFEPHDWQAAFMETYHPGFTLHSESDDEVEAAHAALKVATITYEQLPAVLQRLYRCPNGVDNVPEVAKQLVLDGFGDARQTSKAISLDTFVERMGRLRERSLADELKNSHYSYAKDGMRSREFVSNLEYRATMAKHQRMAQNPRDKALVPVTDAQALGWLKPTIHTERHPTKSCEETRYASAMVKAGVYYY